MLVVNALFEKGTWRRRVVLVGASAAVLVGLTLLLMPGSYKGLASHVTREAIRGVKLGMTEGEVVTILGLPLTESSDGDLKTLEYARPVRARWYPMLWVHLKNGRVSEVYAKRYEWWGVDDEGAYGLNQKERWETHAFEASFPG